MSDEKLKKLKQSAETGDRKSQESLGLLYELGLGVKEDPEQAMHYWQAAAGDGNGWAATSLAGLMRRTAPDGSLEKKARALEQQAAADGFILPENRKDRLQAMSAATRLHVLIVEDDPMVRDLFTRMLSGDHYSVAGAADGREALYQMTRVPAPQMILLDINLPGINGMELLRSLRSLDKTSSIPIIIISADPSMTYREEAKKLGALSWLTKPVSKPTLLAAVKKAAAGAA